MPPQDAVHLEIVAAVTPLLDWVFRDPRRVKAQARPKPSGGQPPSPTDQRRGFSARVSRCLSGDRGAEAMVFTLFIGMHRFSACL